MATAVATGLATFVLCLALFIMVALPKRACAEAPRIVQKRDVYQQWIHDNVPACCDHRDCAPATVNMTFTGWQIAGADNVVPFAQVIRWPFNVPYACIASRRARCLLMDVRM